jgi:hypothetical protein
MATLTVQNVSDEDGTTITFAAAAGGGDQFEWSEDTALIVVNGGVGSINVTIAAESQPPANPQFGELIRDDIVKAVAAGATAVIPPVPRAFRDAATGMVALAYSGVTSVTVAAIRF